MSRDKTASTARQPTRERVLDAAERLLAQGSADFSMRELADDAGVSFATPFNQFGGKGAIMLALSSRRIAAMHAQLGEAVLPEAACGRVLLAVDIAVQVMLASPAVNRVVMGAIGSPNEEPGEVSAQSRSLWAEALGPGEELLSATRPLALAVLPDHLAIAFRGVLSFWTAGEIPDASLGPRARAAAAAALLGFVARDGRIELLVALEHGAAAQP
ncbi:TetR/AcrR family transcriptional regulator [Methylobacterium sp. C25]|uniref:TetR/AcrR family transcriptional regulator n=1 Tax=Methylobacterium sp. C25 TaxID=2721622 RepID=UPI001F368AFF|nr:TetR/AcrR family transcriptional regulator [Methylobacterium sp. C25]MCE4222397.1 TetR/AcrR family transcriptional regulator [Methylobacterium sp. C25]